MILEKDKKRLSEKMFPRNYVNIFITIKNNLVLFHYYFSVPLSSFYLLQLERLEEFSEILIFGNILF